MNKKRIEEIEATIEALTKEIKSIKETPKFEVGWYKSTKESDYFIYRKAKEHYRDTYGIVCGVFKTDVSFESFHEDSFRPATHSEVETALIAEAKRRGFKEGVVLSQPLCLINGWDAVKGIKITGKYFKYRESEDCLRLDGKRIYSNGQWAEIIKDDKIEIGGYEVRIETDICNERRTSIDNNKFTKDFWQAAKLISEHSKAKIMVGCSKQFDVSLETINKILAKL